MKFNRAIITKTVDGFSVERFDKELTDFMKKKVRENDKVK